MFVIFLMKRIELVLERSVWVECVCVGLVANGYAITWKHREREKRDSLLNPFESFKFTSVRIYDAVESLSDY